MAGGVAILAQACGGGSAATKATPTAKPLPSRPAAQGTPGFRGGTPPADFTPGAGIGDRALLGGLDPALAQFLGIQEDQLRTELAADGATIGTVAQAHGKTPDELKAFLLQQIRSNADQAVAAGRMSQDQADSLVQNFSSRVDDMIDGKMPIGGRPAPTAQPGQ
jgi:hypothetical protein